MLKKIASIFTGVTVICWLSGLAMLVPLPVHAVINEGDLIRGPDGIKVYIVNADGYKRHIYNPDVFNIYGHFTWESIQEVDQATIDSYTTSDLYRVDVEYQVYSVGEDGIKHWLNMTAAEFVECGYSWNQVFIVNATEGAYYTVGSEILPCGAVAGGLTVALADDTPVASQVPVSTTNVPYTYFNFTAGSDGDVSITALTIKRSGLASSPSSDFDNVKLFDGATQVGESRSVNSTTDLVTFSLTAAPITISAGTTKKIDVKVDIASGAIDDNLSSFGINASTDITTDASAISGTFPVTGNTMTVNDSVTVATVTVTEQGSGTTVYLGNEAATVGKFRLAVSSQENVEVRSLKITQAGSADSDDLSNIKLYQGTTLLKEVATMNADNTLVFDLTDSPFAITKGLSKDFEIKADIVGGYARTVIFYFDEAADLNVVGVKYGFGSTVTLTSFSSSDYETYDISGGVLNFTLASDTPTTGNVSEGATNFSFAKFNFVTGDEAVLIKNVPMTLTIVGTPVADEISNIRISDGTTSYSATDPTCAVGDVAFYFPDDFTIPANTTLGMSVIGDVSASATATSYQFKLLTTAGSANTNLYAKGVTSGKNLTDSDIVPSGGTITARVMTLQSSQISVALASTPASRNVVEGVSDVEIAGFNLTAGDASAIKITGLIVIPYSGVATNTYTIEDGTNLQNSTLYYGDTQLGNAKNIVSEQIAFDGFELTIPAGSTKKVIVKGNIPSSRTADYLKMGIPDSADSTYITAADDSGSTPTISISGADNGTLSTGTSLLTLRDSDTLAIAASADTPNSTIVVGSTSGAEFSKFKLSATNEYEPILLTKFVVQATISASSTVGSVYLYDGTTLLGSANLNTSDRAVFSGLSVEVPKTSYKTLTVKADVSVINEGATSGDSIEFECYATDTEADGYWSGGTADPTGGTTNVANAMIVRKTVPTINLNASSPEGAQVSGINEVFRFDVEADAAADVTLDILTFAMSSQDNGSTSWNLATSTGTALTTGDFKLYDADDPNTELTATTKRLLDSDLDVTDDIAGDNTQVYGFWIDLATIETIAAGGTNTYILEVDTSGAGGSTTVKDYVRFDLKGEGTGASGAYDAADSMSWSDDDGTTDWDGGYVKNLDVDGKTLQY